MLATTKVRISGSEKITEQEKTEHIRHVLHKTFHVVVVQNIERNVQRSVLHVQSCRSAHFFLIEFLFSRRSSRKKLANGFASNDRSSGILWSTTLSDNGQDVFFGFKYR